MTIDLKVMNYISVYVNKLAFIDDKITSIQILRNDNVFGMLSMIQQRCL